MQSLRTTRLHNIRFIIGITFLSVTLSGCFGSGSSSGSAGAASSGRQLYVSPTGSDSNDGLSASTSFATLQHAADQAQPGDTVNIMAGTYENPDYGAWTINNPVPGVPLNIKTSGTAQSPITFQAYAGSRPVIQFNGWAGIYSASASYIAISGLEIAGNAQNVTSAYAISNETTTSNSTTNAPCIAIGNGSSPYPGHFTIKNMVIHDCPGGGISFNGADYVTVQGNTIYDSAYWSPAEESGISLFHLVDSDGNTGYKNFVEDNTSYANQNEVPGIVSGTITDGNGIIIDDNKHAQDTNVAYNGRTLVADNVVYDNGGAGVSAYSSQHIDLLNNTAYENNQTSSINEGQVIAINSSDVNILNNILYAPSGKTVNSNTGNSSLTVDYNVDYGGTGAVVSGSHDLTADPLFVDAASADFQLQGGSPALLSGTSDLAPASNILGNAWSGGIDRGAY